MTTEAILAALERQNELLATAVEHLADLSADARAERERKERARAREQRLSVPFDFDFEKIRAEEEARVAQQKAEEHQAALQMTLDALQGAMHPSELSIAQLAIENGEEDWRASRDARRRWSPEHIERVRLLEDRCIWSFKEHGYVMIGGEDHPHTLLRKAYDAADADVRAREGEAAE